MAARDVLKTRWQVSVCAAPLPDEYIWYVYEIAEKLNGVAGVERCAIRSERIR